MSMDGYEEAVQAFSNEVAPESRPRDQAGRFVQVAERPVPMFSERRFEGEFNEERQDGNREERSSAVTERQGRQRVPDAAEGAGSAAADDRHELQERSGDGQEPDDGAYTAGIDFAEPDEREGSQQVSEQDAEAEKYEVIVDGERHEVTFNELVRGYQREATFHKRMSAVDQEHKAAQQQLQIAAQAREEADRWIAAYQHDYAAILPEEPNWQKAFEADPRGAWQLKQQFEDIRAKLVTAQQARMRNAQAAEAERRAALEKYAVDGFTQFIINHQFKNEEQLKYEIRSMRRTAQDAGFNEAEIAQVYDPRMMTILQWASEFRRRTANRPKALPAARRALPPGSATPIGNVARKGMDEALRQQARSGSIDDTAAVFRRMGI